MTLLQDRFAALVAENGPTTTLPTEDLLNLMAELQLAAILLCDLGGAMPMRFQLSMPEDLSRRLYATHYQDVLDQCVPAELRAAVKELVDLDPEIIRAREVHAAGMES